MYLIFDCSAIAKPTNYKAPFSDTFAWPRLIHLSWILLNSEYKPIEDFDCIVKPDGFTIDENVEKNAHIDADDIVKKGAPLEEILDKFSASVDKAEYIFAHNLSYNENVVGAEYIRKVKSINMFKKERYCLMQESTYYCKLPAKGGGYKWPTLNELHATCFNHGYKPTNNARADVIAAARCFIKLKKTGQLEDLFEE
ncbi:MAG: 3'-5' exonuclease [Saprospiraceae bacterium]|nr:3'-5' exonuclease [Saprospiraceae bacterium]